MGEKDGSPGDKKLKLKKALPFGKKKHRGRRPSSRFGGRDGPNLDGSIFDSTASLSSSRSGNSSDLSSSTAHSRSARLERVFSKAALAAQKEEDAFFRDHSARSTNGPGLQKTWSVNAFGITGHSAGVLYVDGSSSDDDDGSSDDSDDDSGLDPSNSSGFANDDIYLVEEEDEDEEDENENENRTNGTKNGEPMRRSYRDSATMPDIIQEGSNEEETEDDDIYADDDNDNDDHATNNVSPISSGSEKPTSGRGSFLMERSLAVKTLDHAKKPKPISKKKKSSGSTNSTNSTNSNNKKKKSSKDRSHKKAESFESGDDDDDDDVVVVGSGGEDSKSRSRGSMKRSSFSTEGSTDEYEGMEGTGAGAGRADDVIEFTSSKRPNRGLMKDESFRSRTSSIGIESIGEDSIAGYVGDASADFDETIGTKTKKKKKTKSKTTKKKKGKGKGKGSTSSSTTKKGKRKKKKKGGKKKKKKEKRAFISFEVRGDDDANDPYEIFDKRLQEIELFEHALMKDKLLLQKQREAMAFEIESMEMRLDEEVQASEDLEEHVRHLEQQLQSYQISDAGNKVETMNEREAMKYEFNQEKDELLRQISDKDAEIEDLKSRVDESKPAKKEDDEFAIPNRMAEGKSRERLQGEILQMNAKLHEQETRLETQSKELESTRLELAMLMDGNELQQAKAALEALRQEHKNLAEEVEKERKENDKKLSDKDETVTFLMNELARLKMEQSIMNRR
eukprot:CAMPEP_0172378196 /NCGR_PEP_ID=MMETSP1060-20121228/69296_1 /TAXON_ID=37318 /ORGANISM="Pseudo-nitzschia pungens, Strain cf. cingulata" /LENGTH=733 /DNA_ID=CAMNT_0013105911 /DNA_START=317 /DNA_END=2518 /DNA_ORIENTATION=+